MIVIKGNFSTAKIFSNNLDIESIDQIKQLVDISVFKDSKIRIMPDAHKGAGCVIGFTSTLEKKIIPNLIGVDIGCGMLTISLGKGDIDYKSLDRFIHSYIPHGFKGNKKVDPHIQEDIKLRIEETCKNIKDNYKDQILKIGSLGGGNHFIEIDLDEDDNKYLIIHTGSRNFGLKVANYYQNIAHKYCIKNNIELPKSLCYLEGKKAEEYKKDMKIAQDYAHINRYIIAKRIVNFLRIKPIEQFETIHNYINFEDNIIRKGAVSAKYNEKLLIPLNMRDGCIIAKGKGISDWNYSAPHGAGRRLSRNKAKKELSLEEFKSSMKDIYTTSVKKSTLDEAPMAYKDPKEIIENIEETVTIEKIIKPIYNFKAE